jgi:hypothetical protein
LLIERTGFPFNADLAVAHTWADKKNRANLKGCSEERQAARTMTEECSRGD